MTSVTGLAIDNVRVARSFPTSVVEIKLTVWAMRVAVSETENLKYIAITKGRHTTTLCPRLQAFDWHGKTRSQKTLPAQSAIL